MSSFTTMKLCYTSEETPQYSVYCIPNVCVQYVWCIFQYATNTLSIRYQYAILLILFLKGCFSDHLEGVDSFCVRVRIFPLRISMYTNIINHISIVKSFLKNYFRLSAFFHSFVITNSLF